MHHTGLLTYKKVLSLLWHLRVGIDNILTRYLHNRDFKFCLLKTQHLLNF